MKWVMPPPDPGERLRRIAALKAGRGPQRATGGIATPRGMLARGGAVKPKLTKAQGAKASAKISHLHKTEPKMPHKQMVGMAMNMAREGRLGSKGGYTPKKATKRAKKR